jgi:hypothetical protein
VGRQDLEDLEDQQDLAVQLLRLHHLYQVLLEDLEDPVDQQVPVDQLLQKYHLLNKEYFIQSDLCHHFKVM